MERTPRPDARPAFAVPRRGHRQEACGLIRHAPDVCARPHAALGEPDGLLSAIWDVPDLDIAAHLSFPDTAEFSLPVGVPGFGQWHGQIARCQMGEWIEGGGEVELNIRTYFA